MKREAKLIRIITTLILILIVGTLYFFNAFGSLENLSEDVAYQHGHLIPSDITIIAIDNKTLEELGPYHSWDRSVYADLIDKLHEDNNAPSVIGLDIVFSGESSPSEDERLAKALKDRNFVLASKVDVSTRSNIANRTYEYYISDEETAYQALNDVTKHGFTNAILDADGILRKSYSYLNSDGKEYDSFAVAVLKASGEEIPSLKSVFGLSYTGHPGEFEHVSMSDVLNGKIPASHFNNSIILIGAYEDGLMDSYSTSINHKNPMYGVEIQANAIEAIRNGYILKPIPKWIFICILVAFMVLFALLVYRNRFGVSFLLLALFMGLYAFLCFILYRLFFIQTPVLYLPVGLLLVFLAAIIIRYVETQKSLATEMKQTLFSIADSMAEAIEGRTPYNANHTKNVAKRSVEMIDYINDLYKKGKTDYHFSPNDRDQMYLAAMLHDIGKMDVPLDIMDKATKLGSNEERLKTRLEMIKLHIMNDSLKGEMSKSEAEQKCHEIDTFLSKLDVFNCGKPLNFEEKSFVEHMGRQCYKSKDGNDIPYLTKEEIEELSITAGTLSDEERKIMQSHVVYTEKILSHVHFGQSFDKVSQIADHHHELLNGKGYPNGISASEIDVMTRILTIMDIYDSLIAEDRPYKKPKTVSQAFEILDEEANAGKIDKDLLQFAKELYLKN